jgi:hypothetical protein
MIAGIDLKGVLLNEIIYKRKNITGFFLHGTYKIG